MRKNWLISRRTALKGLGVALGLPLLETMGWAETPKGQKTNKPPVRLAFMYMALGVHQKTFWPTDAKSWPVTLPPTLEPLRPVVDQCLLLGGIDTVKTAPLTGVTHELELSTWLTATRPNPDNKTVIDIAPSADQIAAQHLGLYTVLPSLELGIMRTNESGIDNNSGLSRLYFAHGNFRTATQPLPVEISPAAVLKRLFSSRQSTAKKKGGPAVDSAKFANPNAPAEDEQTLDRSMLDLVRDSAKDLRATVSIDDQRRIDDYLDGVRSLETRIAAIERQQAEADAAAKAGKSGSKSSGYARSEPIEVKIPPGTPKWSDHIKLMGDLMVLAFQTDTTRVTTLMGSRPYGTNYPELGFDDGHHPLSHHFKDLPIEFERLNMIERLNIATYAYIVDRMRSVKEGGGTLLDNSIFMWGSGMGTGQYHTTSRLPCIIAGKGGGTIRTGRYVEKVDGNQGDLLTAILARAGVPLDKPIGIGTKMMPDLS